MLVRGCELGVARLESCSELLDQENAQEIRRCCTVIFIHPSICIGSFCVLLLLLRKGSGDVFADDVMLEINEAAFF